MREVVTGTCGQSGRGRSGAPPGHTAAGLQSHSWLRTEVVRKESNMKSFLVVPVEFDPAGKVEYGEARQVS